MCHTYLQTKPDDDSPAVYTVGVYVRNSDGFDEFSALRDFKEEWRAIIFASYLNGGPMSSDINWLEDAVTKLITEK